MCLAQNDEAFRLAFRCADPSPRPLRGPAAAAAASPRALSALADLPSLCLAAVSFSLGGEVEPTPIPSILPPPRALALFGP